MTLLDTATRPWSLVSRAARAVDQRIGMAGPDGRGLFTDAVEDVEELAEDGAELLEDVVEEGTDLLEDSLGRHRRVWEADGHAQIEAQEICDPRADDLRRRLKSALERVDAVRWVEVNSLTGRVAVAFDRDATGLASIVTIVEGVEQSHGVRRRRLEENRAAPGWELADRSDHPSDVEPIHRAIAAIAGNAVGLGWSIVGRVAGLPRLPAETASLTSLIESQPLLRQQLERRLGKPLVELLAPLASAVATGIAQGVVGNIVDIAYQASLLGELRARQAVWCAREPEFYATQIDDPVEPPDLTPRPVPLPDGPVEAWSGRVALGSTAGFLAVLAATGDGGRAADTLPLGMPKAAGMGREGFAAQLGRALAARGIVPLDASALRRLDRVDTVVLDSASLLSERVEIADVVAFGDLDEARASALTTRLLDPEDAGAIRREGEWTLRPFADLPDRIRVPRGGKTRARELRGRGQTVLALCRKQRVEALACGVAELLPGADELVATVRRAGLRLVIAGRNGRLDRRCEADATIPSGRRMGAAIRGLQAEGAVVAAVVRRGTHGLAAADVGINVGRRSGRPSWGADLLCGRDLAEASAIIAACPVAAQVSRRSAQLAVAGSSLAAVAIALGPPASADYRALAVVNGAAGVALAAGTWSGVVVSRRTRGRPERPGSDEPAGRRSTQPQEHTADVVQMRPLAGTRR